MAELKNQIHEHWLSRDYETSARLYLQHWLFQTTLGYVLDPVVSTAWRETQGDRKLLRVADLGCGNAAWLLDLACGPSNHSGVDLELYGFDILPAHFPAAEIIPPNVKLIQKNILDGEFSKEFVESFDLVHVRAFGSSIRNSDTSPICQVAMKLLRPGGSLQWEEADTSSMIAVLDSKAAPRGTTLIQLIEAGGKATGTTYDWFESLGQQVEANGFNNVVVEKHPLKTYQGKAWTEDYLLAFKDLGHMLPSEKDVPQSPMTRESYNALFASVVEEARKGMVMHSSHLLTVVGKK